MSYLTDDAGRGWPMRLVPGRTLVRSARAAELTTQRLLASGLSGMRAYELAIRAEFGCAPREMKCGCVTDGKTICYDHAPRAHKPRAMQEGRS